MLYFRHPSSLAHDPSVQCLDHPDTPERIAAIEAAMSQVGWLGCDVREAPAATERELELVHSAAHVARIRDLCMAGGGQIDADTFVGEKSYSAALHAAGGACELVRALVRGEARAGFSAMRPSGHHAGQDYAMGFCLFNNVAIAAELAIRELGVERVLIIDWDVHHGNGTADIFRRRPDVLFASIHELGLFPGTGEVSDAGSAEGRGYTINVPGAPRVRRGDVGLHARARDHPRGRRVRPAARADLRRLRRASRRPARPLPARGQFVRADGLPRPGHGGDTGRARRRRARRRLPPRAVTDSVMATITALAGVGTAYSIAPDPFVTSRVAAHVGHYWTL